MDDRSQVAQPPIELKYAGGGPFRTVQAFTVPDPPEGCESEQLLDWGSVLAVLAVPIDNARRSRVIEAYALRWGIETVDAKDA